jgi:hypothetical protein
MEFYVVTDENGGTFALMVDEHGGLPVLDEDGNVFSLVLTEA